MSLRSRGPDQFTSRIRPKYVGVRGNDAGQSWKNASSLMASNGFVARSAPSVDVCSAPLLPVEQNEPDPWVGISGVSPGRSSNACCRVSYAIPRQALRELRPRQVRRAAPPTISAPPLNNTGASSPSRRNT